MLRRIAAKFIASPDSAGSLDLHPFIGIFHRFIQQGAVPGLLVDVADYAHVPDGPGVMLIGHDVDYGIDRSGGRAGLLTTRKRCADLPLAEVLRDTLQRALQAMAAIEADDATDLRFGTAAVTLQFIDRLATPNTDEAFESVRGEIAGIADRLYGPGRARIEREHADDPRRVLTVRVEADAAADASALIGRLAA
jgi:hypothetical protein